jgi:hypothetical protein
VTDETRARVMAALLKSLYNQAFISEDIYHHSLSNLPKTVDFDRELVYDVVKTERTVGTGGRL